MDYHTLVQALITVSTETMTVDNVNDAIRAAYGLGKKHGRLEPKDESILDEVSIRKTIDTAQSLIGNGR